MADVMKLRQTAGFPLPSSRIVFRFHRHRGAAATETLLIALPLFLTGLGTLEAARWWGVRQAVGLAAMEAAREGSTTGADPAAIGAAMARSLLPLTATDASPAGIAEGEARHRQAAASLAAAGLAPWEIRVLSPRRAHFDDFARNAAGGRALPDTYQAERHRGELDGARGGRGAASGDTIFSANTLVLEATYLHVPLVPGMSALLRGLGQAAPAGLAGDGMRRAGLLPMTLRVSLPMQTPARETAVGAVIRPALQASPSAPTAPVPGPVACAGLWCTPPGSSVPPAVPPAASAPPATPAPTLPWDPPTTGGSPGMPPPAPPGSEDGCGVVLCCPGGATLPV